MIYVNQKQLDQVEYLIQQSLQGHHVLFDTETVRRIYGRGATDAAEHSELSPKLTRSVERHIEELIAQPSLEMKRAYLHRLDRKVFEHVVRTYFNIVENSLYELIEVRH